MVPIFGIIDIEVFSFCDYNLRSVHFFGYHRFIVFQYPRYINISLKLLWTARAWPGSSKQVRKAGYHVHRKCAFVCQGAEKFRLLFSAKFSMTSLLFRAKFCKFILLFCADPAIIANTGVTAWN